MREDKDNCFECKHAFEMDKKRFCRRYPPQLISHMGRNPISGQIEQGALTAFPMITKEMVCGEFVLSERAKRERVERASGVRVVPV